MISSKAEDYSRVYALTRRITILDTLPEPSDPSKNPTESSVAAITDLLLYSPPDQVFPRLAFVSLAYVRQIAVFESLINFTPLFPQAHSRPFTSRRRLPGLSSLSTARQRYSAVSQTRRCSISTRSLSRTTGEPTRRFDPPCGRSSTPSHRCAIYVSRSTRAGPS